ncbi:MAG: 23S rRNA (adenine(2503)-C(2))-methyltransferase RlmN, partial [Anaerovorax sp.]
MINLKNLTLEEMKEFFLGIGEKPFRATQVYQWIYRGITKMEDMTDLSKDLREKLNKEAKLESLKILQVQKSEKDGTRKYLFGLPDGQAIESVFMEYKYGNSLCISSQAGCRMGCKFCASTVGGFVRNLTAGEMADQLISVERDTGKRISHVVIMGVGEPLDNYKEVSRFLRMVNCETGLNLGMRNITLSTCGVIPVIKEFSKDFPQVNLAISLHSPTDEVREKMMPINGKYPLDE